MINNNVIFDIGANSGINGIALALFNPKIKVFAFEGNTKLLNIIKENKKKIEKIFGKKILNYKIINKAVSNYNGFSTFYISHDSALSSLNKFSNKNKFGDKFIKKNKVQVITLALFCKKNKIQNICYLHSDTQGSDLKVLIGLKKFRNHVYKGVLETLVNSKIRRYAGESYLSQIKKKFKIWNFKIENIALNFNEFEYNIYYKNNNFVKNSNFISPKINYNTRFFYRVIENRLKLKDHIYINYLKLKL